MIDWDKPVEWNDGTYAVIRDKYSSWVNVNSAHEPAGWDSHCLPRLGPGRPGITVRLDGTIDTSMEGAPFIRNIEIPTILFSDGSEAARIAITKAGTVYEIKRKGKVYQYSRATGQPMTRGAPKIEILSKHRETMRVVEQEQAEAEQEALEESPLYGMF